MILKNIDILNFKNIAEASIEFSCGVNCLLGMNGMGKSNLLDAIHFLSVTRPMSPMPENELIRHGEETAMVKGTYRSDTGSEDNISCGLGRGKPKKLKRNGKEYSKVSEHIGRYPIVSVTPGDTRIITGPGEERRKLMDMVISQGEPQYLSHLLRYNKALETRNKMLRAGIKDSLLYESVENVMIEAGTEIFTIRKERINLLSPITSEIYRRLAGKGENVEISYTSRLNETSMKDLLDEKRQKDIVLGYTSAGVHRDDLETLIDGYSLRRCGSQGQTKTFTVALRLAIFRYLKEAKGITPILLLDDIFDKLDSSRVGNIMENVSSDREFGQIFITDTNRKHLDTIMEGLKGEKIMLNVKHGSFTPIQTSSE